jgi:hypothetical protein
MCIVSDSLSRWASRDALHKRVILQQVEERWFSGLFALQKGIAILN